MSDKQTLYTTNRYGHELQRTITFGPKTSKNWGKPRCCQRTWGRFDYVQCDKVGKYTDDDGYTWCGHHTKEAFQKKRDAREARLRKWHSDFKAKLDRDLAIKAANEALMQAMRDISAGHNNPRTLAQEVLDAYDRAIK